MQEVTFGSKIELQVSVTRTFWKNCPILAKSLPKLGKTTLDNVAKRSRNHPNRDILPNVITLLAFETLFLDMEVS